MKTNLKIAVVGGSLSGYGGGAPRSMASHAAALKTQGIEVTIYAGYSKKYPLTPAQFNIEGIETVTSPLWGPSVLGFAVKMLWILYRRANEYDVIHLNGHWNLTTFLGALISRIRKVPYVITVRGHLGKYDFKHLWFLKLFLYPLMEIPNIRHAALMHVCSEWERQDSQRALAHAKKVATVPNAVDCKTLLPPLDKTTARQALGLPDNIQVYLFLSRVAPDKSPEMLIRSWAKANKGPNALLVVAGPADPIYEQHLHKLAASLQVSNRILFPGYLDNESKRKWYSAADVFVLPSTDDSFSVAVIEAAHFGLSCILSPYVGASEYIPKTQVRIVELDQDAWAKALSAEIPAATADNSAEETWKLQFTLESIGAHWKALYNEIILSTS